MSYPQKISRDVVLQAALSQVATHGLDALSMRSLAAHLGVTPNALYRYFPSKGALAYAMADAVGTLMLDVIQRSAQGLHPLQALPVVAQAYVQFARDNPDLYGIKVRHCNEPDAPESHNQIWRFVTDLAETLHTPWPSQDLAVALWAFLHGMVELDRANALQGRPAELAMQTGLQVMIAGLLSQAGHGPGATAAKRT